MEGSLRVSFMMRWPGAWADWFYPTTRIWIDVYNISAVYTPDGMAIQFDNGTIWQRYVPPPPPVRRRR
ncbi:MAG TPA: hypothetical protein VGJ08_13185 [Rhizomicrobium sp.]|jgi:hypothetical protein